MTTEQQLIQISLRKQLTLLVFENFQLSSSIGYECRFLELELPWSSFL
jgi:hypothetical protein